MNYHGKPWTTMIDHELPCQFMVFDHVLLNDIMVFDHGSLWSTMVVHGRPWSISSDASTLTSGGSYGSVLPDIENTHMRDHLFQKTLSWGAGADTLKHVLNMWEEGAPHKSLITSRTKEMSR